MATPDPKSLICFFHSAKLAKASCKQGESKDSEATSFISSSLSFCCFWDIKGKTINSVAGCPTFPGRERKKREFKKNERERGRIPKDATPSDWAAVLGGSWASPNYSRLVTSWGRRWRSSQAGTINQKRLACSQGDWREVFKGRRGERRGSQWERLLERSSICSPSANKQDIQRDRAFVVHMWFSTVCHENSPLTAGVGTSCHFIGRRCSTLCMKISVV